MCHFGLLETKTSICYYILTLYKPNNELIHLNNLTELIIH